MSEPRVSVRAYHTSAGSNFPITRVVIHTTEPGMGFPKSSAPGQAHSVAEYFTSPASGGSAHYVIDEQHEEHCVPENVIAWHAPPNQGSLGIEICGQAAYTHAEWRSDALKPLLDKVAARTADLCHRYGVPVVKLNPHDLLAGRHGLCGHRDVSDAWHQSDHQDPGANFPWPHFLELVKEHMGKQPAHHNPQPALRPKFPGRVLVLGMHGNDVQTWQHQMAHRGWKIKVTGQFGPQTHNVCVAFQKEKGLGVDGKIGPMTWAAAWTAPVTAKSNG